MKLYIVSKKACLIGIYDYYHKDSTTRQYLIIYGLYSLSVLLIWIIILTMFSPPSRV